MRNGNKDIVSNLAINAQYCAAFCYYNKERNVHCQSKNKMLLCNKINYRFLEGVLHGTSDMRSRFSSRYMVCLPFMSIAEKRFC